MSRRAFLAALGAGLATGFGSVAAAGAVAPADVLGREGSALRTRTRDERHHVQPDAVFEVPTDKAMVALSLDDGPDPAYTPGVLRLLGAHHARATFFLVGANALAHPRLVAAQLAAGHSIGNHTYDHRELELLPRAVVDQEIDRAGRALVAAGAPKPTLFRPPKGFTDQVVGVEARRDRYTTVFWTQCLEHFVVRHGLVAGVGEMLLHVRPGAVLLAHDGGTIVGSGRPSTDRRATMEALPLLLAGLAARGLRVVDVPTLLHNARRR